MERPEVRKWRLNKTVLPVLLMVVAFGLLSLPIYHVPLVRIPVMNPAPPNWVSGDVGAKRPAASFLSLVVGYIPDAVETVREERNELQAERDAFDAFRKKVGRVAKSSRVQ